MSERQIEPESATNDLVVRGKRLEALWWRPHMRAGDTALVFLHEGLGSAGQWRDIPARLASLTGLETMAFSRLGYGRSDPITPPRSVRYLHEEAEVLPETLAAAGLQDRPVILIGHSDGGSIALIHAAGEARPRPRALILEAPHVFVEDLSIASIEQARQDFLTTDLRDRMRKRHGDNVDGAFWGWNCAWLDPEFRKFDITALLPKIAVPVLVIQGREDQYGTLEQVAAIARGVSGEAETLILPGARHAAHRDQPERVLEAMHAFTMRAVAR